jgi:phosphatidylserine decarboxylase
MPAFPVRYYDRYAGAVKTERIYGEQWLRWAYENPAGRLLVWALIRRAWFSRWYGRKMKKKASANRVLPFVGKYEIDWQEFEKSPFDYRSFNEFFCRALKPGARPIAPGEDVAVLPADGRHFAFGRIEGAEGIYAKGQRFSLAEFLRGGEEASLFAEGSMLISRLCPVDYHRFHFPVDGVPGETRDIAGWLYSVNPVALRRNIGYLLENKRKVTLIDAPRFGHVAMVEVGATNVGSIQESFVPGRPAGKGEEKGFFSYGGSCIVTLFQHGRIRFSPDLLEQTAAGLETFARMGDVLGWAKVN